GEALAGAVTGVFNDHHMFTESVTDFYAYLASVLTRYDLAGEEYVQFKALLLDYVDLISADVNRNAPEILERLRALLRLIDRVLENLPAVPGLDGELFVVERLPGRTRSEWEQLAVWYGAGDARSGPDQLRAARRQSEARHAAAAELLAAGSLHRSRLSRAARDLLLDKLSVLFAAVSAGAAVVEHRDTDLGLLLRATPTKGSATVVTGDDGTIT